MLILYLKQFAVEQILYLFRKKYICLYLVRFITTEAGTIVLKKADLFIPQRLLEKNTHQINNSAYDDSTLTSIN